MTAVDAPRRASATGGARRPRLGDATLVVLLLAAALVPFVQDLTAQPAVRYAQTAALVEHGEIDLDRYRDVVGVDIVEHRGRLYSDKGPLQPLLAVPAFAVGKLVGVEDATVLRVRGNLGLWWVTLWVSVVPLLAIAALGVRVVRRVVGRHHIVAPLAIAVGTLLGTYATQLYAHVLTALLGWAVWLAVSRRDHGQGRAALAGALAGAAVAIEYQLVLVVLVVAGVLVARRAWRSALAFAAAGAPFAIGMAVYQWVVFDSPFTVSYGEKPGHAEDPFIVRVPDPVQLLHVLGGARGLLLFSPVVGLAVWGLVRLARDRSPERDEARAHGVVGLLVLAAFVTLQAAWPNPWGGESPGPRYVIPALPFLIVGLAQVWDAAPRVRRAAVLWSVFALSLPVVAFHLVPGDGWTVVSHLQHLQGRGAEPTLWTMLLGPFGWIVHLASVAALGWVVRDRLVPDQGERMACSVQDASRRSDGLGENPSGDGQVPAWP